MEPLQLYLPPLCVAWGLQGVSNGDGHVSGQRSAQLKVDAAWHRLAEGVSEWTEHFQWLSVFGDFEPGDGEGTVKRYLPCTDLHWDCVISNANLLW